jgi:hypothetical protein
MTAWLDMRPAEFGKPTATVSEPLFAAPEPMGTPDMLTVADEPAAPAEVATGGIWNGYDEADAAIHRDEIDAERREYEREAAAEVAAEVAAAPALVDQPPAADPAAARPAIYQALRAVQSDGFLSADEWDLIDAVLFSLRHRLGEKPRSGGDMSLGAMAVHIARITTKRMEGEL